MPDNQLAGRSVERRRPRICSDAARGVQMLRAPHGCGNERRGEQVSFVAS